MDVLLVAAILFAALFAFGLFGKNKIAELDEEIRNLQDRITVVTSNSLPDREIKGVGM